jgi:hypothetical protein
MPSVKYRVFKPITPGDYRVQLRQVVTRQAKRDGSDFYVWGFNVVEGDDPEAKSLDFMSPTEFGDGSAAYKMLLAMGVDLGDSEIEFDSDALIGAEVWATVTIEKSKSDGSPRNKVQVWTSIADHDAKVAAILAKAQAQQKPVAPMKPNGGFGNRPIVRQPVTAKPAVAPTRPATPVGSSRVKPGPLAFPQGGAEPVEGQEAQPDPE